MGPFIVMRGRGAWRGNEIKVHTGLGRGLPACRTAGGCLRLVVGLLIVMPGTDRGLLTVMPRTDGTRRGGEGTRERLPAGLSRARHAFVQLGGHVTDMPCIVGLLIVMPGW